jgi:hypothetical protein
MGSVFTQEETTFAAIIRSLTPSDRLLCSADREEYMAASQNIIAVVFDFDDTLTDDSATSLIKSVGIDPKDFWGNKAQALIEAGWDPTPAYLNLLI